ncbi:Mannosylglycerate synthase [Gracilariopsis chorda]|uniref:Mannosylglycerate synthase n=1 Tax=Gracilariopsis chorda TaxID=448386 RepID=A0A2V3IRZ7_9FLOR|nr:Mannosylglycerate synthase [Gracilariopsis chorda]|eukprot:PXF44895.1 Mannosylglycerate synthase [Gracilariopsis chorda]
MALVCFPFKKERVPTVLRNVDIAVRHNCVDAVLLVGATKNECYRKIYAAIEAKNNSDQPYAKPVHILVQTRLATVLRPGKGDGMNTAMQFFLNAHEQPANHFTEPLKRLHFYDADIESFDHNWITKAEDGAALGYDVVRHYFPRSSTDAQVTWQVTKVGFALLWPRTTLPWVQQPLGGELCFTRRVVEALMAEPRVMQQSDWGIDTMYTFFCAQKGFSLLESYVPQGKMHALYGGLRDLKNMLCECFAAVQSLRHEPVSEEPTVHRIDPATPVPSCITEKIGYDIEKSMRLLREKWTARQKGLLELFPEKAKCGLLRASEWPEFMFMDEQCWVSAYKVLLDHFNVFDEDWRELIFKMWVARVLNYTMRHVTRGYHCALQANTEMVTRLHMRRTMELFEGKPMQPLDRKVSSGHLCTPESPPSPSSSWGIEPLQPLSPVTSYGRSER